MGGGRSGGGRWGDLVGGAVDRVGWSGRCGVEVGWRWEVRKGLVGAQCGVGWGGVGGFCREMGMRDR